MDQSRAPVVEAIAVYRERGHVPFLPPGHKQLPRDAFFGEAEQVPAAKAPGRICAETISPHPPGVPALLPGEVITSTVVEYLRSGLAAGMYIPDAADKELNTIRVVARGGDMADRVADVWGGRTPFERGGAWPVRVDAELTESDVDRWVRSACVLCGDLIQVEPPRGAVEVPARVGDGRPRAANELTITEWAPRIKQAAPQALIAAS